MIETDCESKKVFFFPILCETDVTNVTIGMTEITCREPRPFRARSANAPRRPDLR